MSSNNEKSSTAVNSWEAERQHYLRRNFAVGVTFNTVKTVFDPVFDMTTTLPTFIKNLTDSELMVGAVVACQRTFNTIVQIFGANFLETRPRKKYIFVSSEFVMSTLALLVSAVIFVFGGQHHLTTLTAFIVVFALVQMTMGFSFVTMQDLIGKMIPATKRGSYAGTIGLLMRGLGIGSGLVIAFFIKHWSFPTNFGLLFLCLGLTHVFATCIFLLIKEPHAPIRQQKVKTVKFLIDAARLLKYDPAYRRYMFMRFFISLAAMVYPFYMWYGIKKLGVPQYYAGYYTSCGLAVGMVWVFVAGFIANKAGFKILLQVSSLCFVLHPILAISALPLISLFQGWFPSVSKQMVLGIVYVLPFVFVRIGQGSSDLGFFNYLLEIAPVEQRPTYVGLANTLVAPLTIASFLGGIIVDNTSYLTLFCICGFLGLAAFLLACSLVNPRKESRIIDASVGC